MCRRAATATLSRCAERAPLPIVPAVKNVLAGRFQRDVLWNLPSLVFLAASGIALTIGIGSAYDRATLGVFQQVLAVYILFSQLAVGGGINLSALKAIAEHPEDRARTTAIVVGSLVPTLVLAALATGLYVALSGPIAAMLQSDGVAAGIAASAPGLFLFAVNKVLLSVVNGLRRMRAFGVYTSLRYFLILVGLFVVAWNDPGRLHGDQLAFVFTFSEGILFLALAVEVGLQLAWPVHAEWKTWVPVHLRYGMKSVGAGVLLELNSKVDTWMIGVFMSDGDVGIYAIAAMVAEGLFQLLIVLQNNYNPVLARLIAQARWDEMHALVRKGKRWTYALMAVVAVIAVAVYPHFVARVFADPAYGLSWGPFALLMAGILFGSGYQPFAQTLLMSGHPGWHSLWMASTVLCNVIGNAILIPRYGLNGAAAATALAVVVSIFVLRTLVRRCVGVRL